MGRLILLNLLAFSLILVGLGSLNGTLVALATPLIIYLTVAVFYSPAKPNLVAERTLSLERASPQTPVTVKLLLTNLGGKLDEVHLERLVPSGLQVLQGETKRLLTLSKGERLPIEHLLTGKRGYYNFPPLAVTVNDHFDLFRQKVLVEAPASYFVLPQAVPLKQVAIRPRQTKVFAGQIPARRGGPGIEYYGVRDYQTGDPLRRVDWKTSARHPEKLYTKLFQQERAADVGLILDTRIRSDVRRGEHSLFEHAILATATLAETFLKTGNRVGLLLYGTFLDWTFPGYGKVQRENIMQSLARAKQGVSQVFESLDNIPAQLFPPKSQLVLISPLLPGDEAMLVRLLARGYHLLVISPDAIAFEWSLYAHTPEVNLAVRIAEVERQLLIRKIRQAGILVMDWKVDTPFQQAAHAALSRTQMWFRSSGVTA